MTTHRRANRLTGYGVALIGTGLLTLSLLPFRADLTPLSVGFGYLVVVVISAAIGGLKPGVVASVAGFLTFNFFFLPPYGTFVIGRGEYIVVLFVFLALSVLIAALLARAQERAEAALARRAELQALQDLSAALVTLVPGPEGYEQVIEHLLSEFGFEAAALLVQGEGDIRGLEEELSVGAPPGSLSPSWSPSGDQARVERLPLLVGGRSLGILVLAGRVDPLTPAESRVIRAFCDQFALVLERDRLLRSATNAEILRRAEGVRRALLAAVSHDLRSPLAAIKASASDLLADDAVHDTQQTREALESIDGEADRLNGLIADLLDMSRIEGGMLRANVQTLDLSDAADACVERIERQFPQTEISMSVRAGTTVRADPVFLDRIMTNLLENAARAAASATNPHVEVAAGADDGRVSARIIDHGAGVPSSAREQLFYPFYGLSEAKDEHPRLGTGLGLAITKGFLEAMDGQIWVEDTSGGGSTFAFSLPSAIGVG